MSKTDLKLPNLPEGWRWKIATESGYPKVKLQALGWFSWQTYDYEYTALRVTDEDNPLTVRESIEAAAEAMYGRLCHRIESDKYAGVYSG